MAKSNGHANICRCDPCLKILADLHRKTSINEDCTCDQCEKIKKMNAEVKNDKRVASLATTPPACRCDLHKMMREDGCYCGAMEAERRKP